MVGSENKVSVQVFVYNNGEQAFSPMLYAIVPRPYDLYPPRGKECKRHFDDKSITLECFLTNPITMDTKVF